MVVLCLVNYYLVPSPSRQAGGRLKWPRACTRINYTCLHQFYKAFAMTVVNKAHKCPRSYLSSTARHKHCTRHRKEVSLKTFFTYTAGMPTRCQSKTFFILQIPLPLQHRHAHPRNITKVQVEQHAAENHPLRLHSGATTRICSNFLCLLHLL